jgi:hypothetical protein
MFQASLGNIGLEIISIQAFKNAMSHVYSTGIGIH